MKMFNYVLCITMFCSQPTFGMQALAEKQKKIAEHDLEKASARAKESKGSPEKVFLEKNDGLKQYVKAVIHKQERAYEGHYFEYLLNGQSVQNEWEKLSAAFKKKFSKELEKTNLDFMSAYEKELSLQYDAHAREKTTGKDIEAIRVFIKEKKDDITNYETKKLRPPDIGSERAKKIEKIKNQAVQYVNNLLDALGRTTTGLSVDELKHVERNIAEHDLEKASARAKESKGSSEEETFFNKNIALVKSYADNVLHMQDGAYSGAYYVYIYNVRYVVNKERDNRNEPKIPGSWDPLWQAFKKSFDKELDDTNPAFAKIYEKVLNAAYDEHVRKNVKIEDIAAVRAFIQEKKDDIAYYETKKLRQVAPGTPQAEAIKKDAVQYVNNILDALGRAVTGLSADELKHVG